MIDVSVYALSIELLLSTYDLTETSSAVIRPYTYPRFTASVVKVPLLIPINLWVFNVTSTELLVPKLAKDMVLNLLSVYALSITILLST